MEINCVQQDLNLYQRFRRPLSYPLDNGRLKKNWIVRELHIQFHDALIFYIIIFYKYRKLISIQYIERVAGIEPASLAWKARGYSRCQLVIFNTSNSKPNMKFLFHSAPLWEINIFPDLRPKRKTEIKKLRCIKKGSLPKSEE